MSYECLRGLCQTHRMQQINELLSMQLITVLTGITVNYPKEQQVFSKNNIYYTFDDDHDLLYTNIEQLTEFSNYDHVYSVKIKDDFVINKIYDKENNSFIEHDSFMTSNFTVINSETISQFIINNWRLCNRHILATYLVEHNHELLIKLSNENEDFDKLMNDDIIKASLVNFGHYMNYGYYRPYRLDTLFTNANSYKQYYSRDDIISLNKLLKLY